MVDPEQQRKKMNVLQALSKLIPENSSIQQEEEKVQILSKTEFNELFTPST